MHLLKENSALFPPGGLPDPSKALEYIKKFNQIVSEDNRIRGFLIKMTSPDCTCKKAEECVVSIAQYEHCVASIAQCEECGVSIAQCEECGVSIAQWEGCVVSIAQCNYFDCLSHVERGFEEDG